MTAAYDRILAALREPTNGPPAAEPAVSHVGRRQGKAIDGLLTGRVLVVGDDADLAAIVLRLLRKDLLGTVEV
ncbi:MAG: hypothetical protein ABJD68_10660, partial [Nakamurella sp.]